MENNILLDLKKKAYAKIVKIMEHGSNDFREGQVDGILIMIDMINKRLEKKSEYIEGE